MLQRQWPPGIRAQRRDPAPWTDVASVSCVWRGCPEVLTRGSRFTQCRTVQVSARTAWRHPARSPCYVHRGRAKLIASAVVRPTWPEMLRCVAFGHVRYVTCAAPAGPRVRAARFTIGNVWTPASPEEAAGAGRRVGAAPGPAINCLPVPGVPIGPAAPATGRGGAGICGGQWARAGAGTITLPACRAPSCRNNGGAPR